MDLSKIISIAGKPGLFLIVAQSRNGVIVESVLDKKRMPVHSTHKVSALEDITIYTQDEDVPLSEVFQKIHDQEGGKETIDHKAEEKLLIAHFEKVLPKYDREKVYQSDLRKLYKWYNILHQFDLLKPTKKEEKEKKTKADDSADKQSTEAKKTSTKKAGKSGSETPKPGSKQVKKPTAKKTAVKANASAKKTSSTRRPTSKSA